MSQRRAKPLVLVVEDDVVQRMANVAFLSQGGDVEVDSAADGREALEKLRARPADVVLLDLDLPGLSGDKVAAAIRDDVSLSRCQIIILSGRAHSQQISNGYETLGAVGYFTKPANTRAVQGAIRNVIRMARMESAIDDEVMAVVTGLMRQSSERLAVNLGHAAQTGVIDRQTANERTADALLLRTVTYAVSGLFGRHQGASEVDAAIREAVESLIDLADRHEANIEVLPPKQKIECPVPESQLVPCLVSAVMCCLPMLRRGFLTIGADADAELKTPAVRLEVSSIAPNTTISSEWSIILAALCRKAGVALSMSSDTAAGVCVTLQLPQGKIDDVAPDWRFSWSVVIDGGKASRNRTALTADIKASMALAQRAADSTGVRGALVAYGETTPIGGAADHQDELF